MTKDSKAPDEFILMRQIYDNLQFLEYETAFNPIKRHLPFLTSVYFAVPGQSSKEQFDYFAALCIWLMRTFLGSDVEVPSDYDDPGTVSDNIILALPGIGFKLNFSSTKLTPGYGLAVCTILDAVLRLTIKKRKFSPIALRVTGGVGGSEEVETIDDDEDEAIVEDVIEGGSDVEDEGITVERYGTRVVEELDLKEEAVRVAGKLQIRIPAAKSDWRAHFMQMNQYHVTIVDCMNQLAPILGKIGGDVTKAIQAIQTRERTLNARFEMSIAEYADRAGRLASVEAQHKVRKVEVDALQAELNDVIRRLGSVKESLSEKQKEVSDDSPLMKIRGAITKMREQIKALELRSAILQRTLTETWQEDSRLSSDHSV
jgi:estrogen-related receptor beta like 1